MAMYGINFPFLKNAVNMDHYVVGAVLLGFFGGTESRKEPLQVV